MNQKRKSNLGNSSQFYRSFQRTLVYGCLFAISFAVIVGAVIVGMVQCYASKPSSSSVSASGGNAMVESISNKSYTIISPLQPQPFNTYAFKDVAITANVRENNFVSLDDIENYNHFKPLIDSDSLKNLLSTNQFAVDGNRGYTEFFELYEHNRYYLVDSQQKEENGDVTIYETWLQGIPNVVTPDVVLHNFHLYFDFLLAQIEIKYFISSLKDLCTALIKETQTQLVDWKDSAYTKAIEDNLVFLGVAHTLLQQADIPFQEGEIGDSPNGDQSIPFEQVYKIGLPNPYMDRIKAEYQRISEAKTSVRPTLFDYPPDYAEIYSHYKPRGHYCKSNPLRAYFKAMMWLGRISMFFSQEEAVRSALMLSLALHSGNKTMETWSRIFDPITFLVGNPDDITIYEITPVLQKIFGNPILSKDINDSNKFAQFKEELSKLKAPQVQGIATFTTQGPDIKATKGFHLFSQRTVLDQVIFQNLVTPKVSHKFQVSAMELPAILGNQPAKAWIESWKKPSWNAYEEQFDILSKAMPTMLSNTKSQYIAAGWLYALDPLLNEVPDGYPTFMSNESYGYYRLANYLSSFTELKHDTILYAKQGAAELGGPEIVRTDIKIDDRGYVIPEPLLYHRIGELMSFLYKGLEAKKLFPDGLKASYDQFSLLVKSLYSISIKELNDQDLTNKEYNLIRFIGGDLEHFWRDTIIESKTEDRDMSLNDNNAQIIADIFTSVSQTDGQVALEEAIGFVHPIYVVFPLNGKLKLGRGGVYSYYEFESKERLNDAEWRIKLRESESSQIQRPDWVNHYLDYDLDKPIDFYFYSGQIGVTATE